MIKSWKKIDQHKLNPLSRAVYDVQMPQFNALVPEIENVLRDCKIKP